MVVPVDFARLPVIAAIGALFYAEPVEATLFLGAGFIFLGIWINLRGNKATSAGQAAAKVL
jgi:drug/metabolite transporter (DMT)-like permease